MAQQADETGQAQQWLVPLWDAGSDYIARLEICAASAEEAVREARRQVADPRFRAGTLDWEPTSDGPDLRGGPRVGGPKECAKVEQRTRDAGGAVEPE